MKRILLTCSILLATIGVATAQVSKSNFLAKVTDLGAYYDKGNTSGAINAFNELNGLMKTQINYLKSFINTEQATYQADVNKAVADRAAAFKEKQKADSDVVTATYEVSQGLPKSQSDITKADQEVTKAKQDAEIASKEIDGAKTEEARITIHNNKLDIEQKMYNDLQQFKEKNTTAADHDRIMDDLKQFASTLE